MITTELINANAALAGLTDEQKGAICTLSENDENAVIAKKTGEIYGALDADILGVTGIAKNGTEKTYDYAKRVLGEMKAKADSSAAMEKDIKSLRDEKARLEKVIADGAGDAEAAKQLKQAKADLANVTSQYTELNKKYEDAVADFDRRIVGVQVDSSIASAVAGMKFKSTIPDAVRKVLVDQAAEKIKGMGPRMADNGEGGKSLVFTGDDGAVLRNRNNQLKPYTVTELLAEHLESLGVIDKGRRQPGGGTGAGSGSDTLNVTGYKTRTEAYEGIKASLMAQGLAVGSAKFQEAMDKAWNDGNIKSLPER